VGAASPPVAVGEADRVLRPEGIIGAHRRSYLCARWELRITRRCLVEDLDMDPDIPFELAIDKHGIVKAFVREHEDREYGAREVAPLTCGEKVWRLGHGHKHRGACWYDGDNEVMWLCAYGLHRSGEDADAFPYFKRLDIANRLLPHDDDYVELAVDEGYRFAEAIPREAAALLERARCSPGIEEKAMLGSTIEAGLVIESAPPYESVTLALSTSDWASDDWDRLSVVIAAFGLGQPVALGNVDGIGPRKLFQDEIGCEWLLESQIAP
jgi:hypothetical protein